MAEDPIKDQLNWYGYCEANPLTFVDPTGFAASPHLNDNHTQCDLCSSVGFLNPMVYAFAAFGSTPLGLNAIINMNAMNISAAPNIAPLRGGIVLRGTLEQRQELLAYLQMLTRDTLSMERVICEVLGILNIRYEVRYRAIVGNRLNNGTQLIRRLVNSPYTVHIRHYDGPSMMTGLIHPTHRCATVWLNTTDPVGLLVAGPSCSGNRLEDAPIHIILGHELIHALRHFEDTALWGYGSPLYVDPSGTMRRSPTPREELHTIGISYQRRANDPWTHPTGITENALREEHGLPRRLSWHSVWGS